MSSPRLVLLAAVPVLALTGCGLSDDGPRTTQTRDVAAFTRIDNPGSVDVRLRVGEPQRIRVRAGEKVIDDVRTDVRDGTLRITFDHDGWGGDDVVVEASVPKLTGIEASGSGDVDVDGISADAFEARSDGSGDITLNGAAERLVVEVDGSGDAELAGLSARDARVVATGSGDVDVRADERLDVSLDGSGDVRYHGDPALTRRRRLRRPQPRRLTTQIPGIASLHGRRDDAGMATRILLLAVLMCAALPMAADARPRVVVDADMSFDDAATLAYLAQADRHGLIDLEAVTVSLSGAAYTGRGLSHARCLVHKHGVRGVPVSDGDLLGVNPLPRRSAATSIVSSTTRPRSATRRPAPTCPRRAMRRGS